jgi:hypothetical protein
MDGTIRARVGISRETLEKRLEETPSNARCFAQGSSLMCSPILEGLMGTTHGADELGLCSHGLACHASVCGCYIGFSLELPLATPDYWNRNRHNSVKKLVRDSILSTYCSQSQGASFVPIWGAWENFLLLRNVTIPEIHQLGFNWWPSRCFI